MAGVFIVFEGTEGAGKTTIARMVVDALNDRNSPDWRQEGAEYLRELSCTPYGQATESAFIHPSQPLHPTTEVMHLLACKNEMLEKTVKPGVAAGKVLVCDRFSRSFLTYQGGLRGIPMDGLVGLMAATNTLRVPDMEIFLTVSDETRRQRRPTPRDHLEVEVNARHAEFLRYYEEAKAKLPTYYSKTINADGTLESVFAEVMQEIKRYLKFHRAASLSFNSPTRLEALPEAFSDALESDQMVE